MSTEKSPGTVTSSEAAETPQPRCKHILVPGEAHCATCGEQIFFTGLDPTRWQRSTAKVAA